MGEQLEVTTDPDAPKKRRNIEWYWAVVYCVVWFILFYAAAIPSFYNYPETLLIRDERQHTDQFIGERAKLQLLELSNIGVKLTGTVENEVHAINFLLREIEKIRMTSRQDLYDIEVDVQYSSGNFLLWGMATSYHNVSNVIVKLSPKSHKSVSYLLVNSHFDSEVHSPAAADAGVMVVIMLETLRVISQSEKPLRNPIVFLMNGAEESNLLASHGFITQHKWAQYCKALINLDSAGSGGREVLFQSGPNHPWLMKYYKQSVRHPYASTIAEELFQNNFIPSDTDFRVFREYGSVPGLDLAHTLNGYVYHTKFDTYENLERGTYQTTGDNVLALTWALANAPELENPEDHEKGHTIFYDFLGWFMIFYTESVGVAINVSVCVGAMVVIAISIYQMTRPKDADTPKQVYLRFLIILGVQTLSAALAVGGTMLSAVADDGFSLSECWYSEEWLIFGLYFCPVFYFLGLVPAIFIHYTKERTNMRQDDTLACFMHAHCLILIFFCLLMTGLGIRSAFFPMIGIFFYGASVAFNILNRIWGKKYLYWPIHLICQLLPFWFYTYLTFAFFKTFIPMQGRSGPTSNPNMVIAGFSAIMGLLFSGFIIPMLNKFRKAKTIISVLGTLSLVFMVIAMTPVGFPYKKDVAVQRFYALHTSRTFYDENNNVYKHTDGFYVQPVDRRVKTLKKTVYKDAAPKGELQEDCRTETFCGLPLYNSRWMDWKNSARWIPSSAPNLPIPTQITLDSKENVTPTRVRLSFTLKSADRVVIYVDPQQDVKVVDWSFDLTPLKENYSTPYFVYHVYSMTDTPLQFWIEVEREAAREGPVLRLGIGAHFLYHQEHYTEQFKYFLTQFPEWSYPIHWFASFESRYF